MNRHHKRRMWASYGATALVIGWTCWSASPARAWLAEGHGALTRAAVASMPGDVPAFFHEGGDAVAFAAVEPDVMRERSLAQLRDAEAPEHYLDMELLGDDPLPATRHAFIALCAQKHLSPDKPGYLPYAIIEWRLRLMVAFAEHRAAPDSAAVRAACLLYAGRMAHYAEDLCMPLHTTIDHDGRAKPDGSSPRSGIHLKVDALPQKLAAIEPVRDLEPIDDALDAVVEELGRSHALVDRVYELEPMIPGYDDPITDEAVRAFTAERAEASVRLTARLMLQAWRDSADHKLPAWYRIGR